MPGQVREEKGTVTKREVADYYLAWTASPLQQPGLGV